MADPTREQAIEECKRGSRRITRTTRRRLGPARTAWKNAAMRLDHAATLLTRDGRLRERLEAKIAELRERRATEIEMKLHGWESLIDVLKDCADELEAALKEGV